MSRLAIVLCAVLFASEANFSPLAETAENAGTLPGMDSKNDTQKETNSLPWWDPWGVLQKVNGVAVDVVTNIRAGVKQFQKEAQSVLGNGLGKLIEFGEKFYDYFLNDNDKAAKSSSSFDLSEFLQKINEASGTAFSNANKQARGSQENVEKIFGNIFTDPLKFAENLRTDVNNILEKNGDETNKTIGVFPELTKELSDGIDMFKNRTRDDIQNRIRKANDEIENATALAKGINVTECTALTSHLQVAADHIFSELGQCITGKLKEGSDHISSVVTTSKNVSANMVTIDKLHRCRENINSKVSAGAAILCSSLAGIQKAFVASMAVPKIAIELVQFHTMLVNLPTSLPTCMVISGALAFVKELLTIVGRTVKCIHHRITTAESAGLEANRSSLFLPGK